MDKRAELKLKYKQTHRPMGIYAIKNKQKGKMFIGSSVNLDGILNRGKFQLDCGVFYNKELQRDWNEFGETNFSFEILDQIEPKEDPGFDYSEDIETLEKLWLEKLQPYGDKGYNLKK